MATFILDNKGETCDRYTVIITGEVFTMSENALSPQGVNQYSGDMDYLGWDSIDQFIDEHIENRNNTLITLDDVNDDVKKAISGREIECLINS